VGGGGGWQREVRLAVTARRPWTDDRFSIFGL
jgi:hypothetical protein